MAPYCTPSWVGLGCGMKIKAIEGTACELIYSDKTGQRMRASGRGWGMGNE